MTPEQDAEILRMAREIFFRKDLPSAPSVTATDLLNLLQKDPKAFGTALDQLPASLRESGDRRVLDCDEEVCFAFLQGETMSDGRCKDCAYWKITDGKHLECVRMRTRDGLPEQITTLAWATRAHGGVRTEPEFGCVMFRGKVMS